MRRVTLLTIAGAALAFAPTVAHAGTGPEWVRRYVRDYLNTRTASAHALIPAWARKYNMNCSGCHYPAAPRLNATGIRFRWAGYRMPEEIGEKVDVERLQNYVALRGRMAYEYVKTEGQPVSNSGFGFEDATIFYSGPLGRNYSAFFEIEREAEDEVGLTAHMSAQWGTQQRYFGLRFGQMHWFLREGVAGFDRPTGIRTPTPVGSPLTASLPFRFSRDQLGLEAYYVAGRNRASIEVLNGVNAAGIGDEGDADTRKDVVVTNQYLVDDAGSGVGLVGYYGTLVGADTSAPTLSSHFWRVGLSANKIVHNFEILGAVVFGGDQDLPVGGGSPFPTATNKAMGYWLSGQYLMPKSSLTLFGRFEFRDPNTDVASDANRRFVLGGVLPVNLPEYLRLALEYALDAPQGGGAKTHGLIAQVMLNF